MAMAAPTQLFKGWHELTQASPDIIIVHCTKTPDLETVESNGVVRETALGAINSDVEVIFSLKGFAEQKKARIVSECALRQGEYYMVFGLRYDGLYQATESYRIVPLGLNFSTNSLSGKTIDEQIQMLLQLRLNNLNRQMKAEQEEKQRLEEGIKK